MGEPENPLADADIFLGSIAGFPSDLLVDLTLDDGTTKTVSRTSVILAPDDPAEEDVSDATPGSCDPTVSTTLPPRIDGQVSFDWAHSISIGVEKERYYLLIHEENSDIVWPATAPTRGDPRYLLQEFMDFFGIRQLTEL